MVQIRSLQALQGANRYRGGATASTFDAFGRLTRRTGAQACPPAEPPQPVFPRTASEITAEDISERIRFIAADRFKGRAPETPEGLAAAKAIGDNFAKMGLKVTYQDVPFIKFEADVTRAKLAFGSGKAATTPVYGKDLLYWTPGIGRGNVKLDNAPVAFLGYGNQADYDRIDVKGKVVLVLPDATRDRPSFERNVRNQTAAALQRGAKAVFVIHDDKVLPPGAWASVYDQAVPVYAQGLASVQASEEGQTKATKHTPGVFNRHVEIDDGRDISSYNKGALAGLMSKEQARALLQSSGLNYDTLRQDASKNTFRPHVLKDSFSADVTGVTRFKSPNVVAVLEGSDPKQRDDYVLYTGHWDHLGTRVSADPKEDVIYNGAVDNGSGIAMMGEIAEKLASGPRPKRSVAFIAFTGEEDGLLGSGYFAQTLKDGKVKLRNGAPPTLPKHIVGGINIDEDVPSTAARRLAVIGYGTKEYSSTMEDVLAKALKDQNRTLAPDPDPAQNFYQRSDHINLAALGIPMLFPFGAVDLINPPPGKDGVQASKDNFKDYDDNRYHDVDDAWDPNLLRDRKLDGPTQDAQALYRVGVLLANSNTWPTWRDGAVFKKRREQDRPGAMA